MKKILISFLLFTSIGFSQQLKFIGSQLSLGNGRLFSGEFIQGLMGDTVSFGTACYLLSDKSAFYIADSDSLVHFNSIIGIMVDDSIPAGIDGSVYLLYVDVHYLTDGKGSRQRLVK